MEVDQEVRVGESRKTAGDDLRCSTWARMNAVDPVATAGAYRGYLLVEWPLPWPGDAAEVDGLAGAAELASASGFRLQLLAPAARPATGAAATRLRVAVYRWNGSGFAGREETPPARQVAAVVRELLADPGSGSPLDAGATDVLVCGHGSRDRCCGSLGTRLAAEVSESPPGPGDGVRWWRTSHTGGHRFAPTALLLPAGTLWANLDRALLSGVIGETLDPAEAARHYRGCAGVGPREVQAIEREVLALEGWGLLAAARRGEALGGRRFRLIVGTGDSARAFEAEVAVGRELLVPVCGAPVSAARKTEAELVVRGLALVA